MRDENQSMSVRIAFRGRNLGSGFAAFATERMARLSLDGRVTEVRPDRVTIEARGHPVLVDMLEIGCSVGPLDSVVREIERHRGDGTGRMVRVKGLEPPWLAPTEPKSVVSTSSTTPAAAPP